MKRVTTLRSSSRISVSCPQPCSALEAIARRWLAHPAEDKALAQHLKDGVMLIDDGRHPGDEAETALPVKLLAGPQVLS